MKKFVYSALIGMIFISAMSSCDKVSKEDLDTALESRAQALGFDDTEAYVQFVQENCAQGNHENCNILSNGEHRVCNDVNHQGQHCNGESYNGSKHGTCGNDTLICCHGNQGNGNGGHHGGCR